MFESISNKEIYDNSYLGFTFEFFTPVEKRSVAAKFARALGKSVKWFNHLNSDFNPTHEEFKVSPVYSNGYKEISLETGMMPYHEAIHMFLKITHVIESFGYTTDRCSVKTKIQLDTEKLGLTAKMHSLNKFKYLLGLNEKRIFEFWPNRESDENKIYQNHLSFIQPRNVYSTIITESFIESMNPVEFKFPESEFFANDFSQLAHGKLIMSYIGGKNYTNKRKESVSTINIIIERLYETLKENWKYNFDEKIKISKIAHSYKTTIANTKNYFSLKSNYPDIKLYVDLKGTDFLIEANYNLIRDRLFKLIAFGEMKEAYINYDTYRQALQVKDATLGKSILIEGVEFYDCELELDARKCLFQGCNLKNSKIEESTIYSNNLIKNSKLIDCDYLGGSNDIKSSFIKNNQKKIINADLTECLVYSGIFSPNSKIDKNTQIINGV
jgi:hypothetical protein